MKLWYDPSLKKLARTLRKQSTLSEILLWQQLKNGQRQGFDFDRQKPIDRYIVDFFSSELMLVVEIDGRSHKLKGEGDDARQQRLESLDVRLLRFDDRLVKTDINSVILTIDNWIELNGPAR